MEGEILGPTVQITAVENGYLISAHYGPPKADLDSANSIINVALGGLKEGGDPAASFQKAFEQLRLQQSVKRKPVEHHVAKNIDEVMKLLAEILSVMK